MPASLNPATETEDRADDRLMTEAETLCSALLDMGVSLSFDFDQNCLLLGVGDDEMNTGALALFALVANRTADDLLFRDDVIAAVSHLGHYLAEAPGIDADLKTASATRVIKALANAGLLIRHHYEAGDVLTPMLSFMPIPGLSIRPNAHMLMKLAAERFTDEPDFARDLTAYVVGAGQSQHSA